MHFFSPLFHQPEHLLAALSRALTSCEKPRCIALSVQTGLAGSNPHRSSALPYAETGMKREAFAESLFVCSPWGYLTQLFQKHSGQRPPSFPHLAAREANEIPDWSPNTQSRADAPLNKRISDTASLQGQLTAITPISLKSQNNLRNHHLQLRSSASARLQDEDETRGGGGKAFRIPRVEHDALTCRVRGRSFMDWTLEQVMLAPSSPLLQE